MPQVIPIIVEAAAEYAGAGALTVAIAEVVATVAVGLYEQNRARQKARDAYNKSLQDRTLPIRSGVAERQYVVGTVRTSGAVMLIEPIGANAEGLDIVLAIANNECEIAGWYMNEDFISLATFPGTKYTAKKHKSESEKFAVTGPTAVVQLIAPPTQVVNPVKATYRKGSQKGTATVVSVVAATVSVSGLPVGSGVELTISYDSTSGDPLHGIFIPGTIPNPITDWGGQYPSTFWDGNHRLDGCAATRTLFVWDENAFEAGPPAVSGIFTGRARSGYPFYDPRTSTNPVTTSNPALLAGWWMTMPRSLGGCGIPTDWVDWQSIAAAANVCDEIVTLKNLNGTGYTSGKRYECHSVLPTGDSPLVNLDTILSAMAGRRAFTGGKYKIVAGAYRPATMTITDADILGTEPVTAGTYSGEDTPPNVVTASFADANANYVETQPPSVRNSAYITADKYEKSFDLSLSATTDSRRAQYLMGVALEGSRPAMTLSLTLGGIGENLTIYDTAQFNLVNRPQYGGRTFELIENSDNWDGTFTTTWAEIRPQTWALDPDKYTPSNPVTPGDTSYLFNPALIANFVVAAITPVTLPDGTAVMQVTLDWDALPAAGNTSAARVELRYQVAGGDWVGIASVPGDSTGTKVSLSLNDGEVYQFQARFVNGIGVSSNWVGAWTQIAGTPLPSPLSLRLRASSTIFRVPQTGNALPVSITLDAIRGGGLVNTAVFQTSPSVTLTGSGDSRTLPYANMGANESVLITCTVNQASVDYIDTLTIVKVHDGADANTTPDLTQPPLPTGLAVTSFLVHLYVTWDAPVYTQGHGHEATVVYAASAPVGNPLPTFAAAVAVGSSNSNAFAYPAAPGTRWAIWIRHESHDGVLSPTAGGTNGVLGTTAQIGNSNLGPLIVDAGNLVDGGVTTPKIAAAALDATKFASSIQPVGIVSSVPGTLTLRTLFNTTDGRLYKWNGSAYVATTPATDITGQLTDAQIAAIAAAKLTGQITSTQITDGAISTPKLAAGSVTANALAADSVTANAIAANAVTASELAAGAVTAGKIAAGAVTAGTIAAAAVTATEIAAGAITTAKLVVSGQGSALNDDPGCVDNTAWFTDVGPQAQANIPSSGAPGGTVLRLTAVAGSYNLSRSRAFPIIPGKRYRVSAWARQTSGVGTFYLRLWQTDPAGVQVSYSVGIEGVTLSGSFVRYSGIVDTAPTAVQGAIYFWSSYSTGPGVVDMADIRCEEVLPGELIVDGSITARKLFITGGGGAVNDDPGTQDITAWQNYGGSFTIAQITDTLGITTVLRSAVGSAGYPFSRNVAFNPAKTYRLRARARSVGGNGTFYLTVDVRDASNQPISGGGAFWLYSPSGITLPGTFTQYETKFGANTPNPFPSNGRTMSVGALLNYQGTAGYHEITDLLIEEAVDSGLIVDGSIQATHLAANSIAVGTAAIQNGAISNAMIANASIDSAKILELSVNKISAGTLGADINVGAGHIVYDNGIVMRAQGTGFGTSNQFIDWFGFRPPGGNLALCSEINARQFLKVDGSAYFGGSLNAGTISTSGQTTNLAANADIIVGPFGSLGNPITINYSYTYFRENSGIGNTSPTPSIQVILSRQLGAGAFVDVATQTIGGSVVTDSSFFPGKTTVQAGSSFTYIDTAGTTQTRTFRLRINSRTLPTPVGGINSESQNLTVISHE